MKEHRGANRTVIKNRNIDLIYLWRKRSPEGSKTKCMDDLGLSYPTILKYWDAEIKEARKT